MNTSYKAWEHAVTMAMSCLNFTSQKLSDKELATCIDGWIMWAKANFGVGSSEAAADAAITDVFNAYNKNCLQHGGMRLDNQKRVVAVFRRSLQEEGQ